MQIFSGGMVFLHNICWEKNDLPPEYWVFMFNKNSLTSSKKPDMHMHSVAFYFFFYNKNNLEAPISIEYF